MLEWFNDKRCESESEEVGIAEREFFIVCQISYNDIMLYHVMLYHIVSYYIISYHIILYYIKSYYIILYYIITYYIITYYTILLNTIIIFIIICIFVNIQLSCVRTHLWEQRSGTYVASDGSRNSKADPCLPLLAVRPTRCTY